MRRLCDRSRRWTRRDRGAPRGVSREATTSTWMSGKSSSFLRVPSASAPSPRISVRSGGVTRRQIARAATRNVKTLAATRIQSRSSVEAVSSLTSRMRITVASAAVPASARPRIRPSSSIVKHRIERWSRSYRPHAFAMRSQPGAKSTTAAASSAGAPEALNAPAATITAATSARASTRRRNESCEKRRRAGRVGALVAADD